MSGGKLGMKGSHALAHALHGAGIRTLFTVPGGHFLPTYRAFAKTGVPRVISARHELGAGYMASGYALASGRIGAVLSGAPGPGATNLATPVANALADSIPLLVLTAQVDRKYQNRNILQYCDNIALLRQFCKRSWQAVSAQELPNLITAGVQVAQSGRPGPVHIDLPQGLQAQSVANLAEITPRPLSPQEGSTGDVDLIRDAISNCRRPAILAGHGVLRSGASYILEEFANRIGAPVATSRSGIGCIRSAHPRAVGMLGFYGTAAARSAIECADLVFVIGCALGEQTTYGWDPDLFGKETILIQADIDPRQPNLVYAVDHAVIADAGALLRSLLDSIDSREPWFRESQEEPVPDIQAGSGMRAAEVLEAINAAGSDDTIVTADIGNHRLWICEWLKITRPERLIQSCEFDAMGFSLPAAIGAAVAADTQVISISGDGGFVHTMGELAVAKELGARVVAIVFVDGALGILRHQAEELFGGDHYVRLEPIDFASVAEGFGIAARTVSKREQFEEALMSALESKAPALLSVAIDPEEVFPPLRSKIEQRRKDLVEG